MSNFKKNLVRNPPKAACPNGTVDYSYTPTGNYGDKHSGELPHQTYRTCYCEDYCNWDECYLVNPPNTCVTGTNRIWAWNANSAHWFAQTVEG